MRPEMLRAGVALGDSSLAMTLWFSATAAAPAIAREFSSPALAPPG